LQRLLGASGAMTSGRSRQGGTLRWLSVDLKFAGASPGSPSRAAVPAPGLRPARSGWPVDVNLILRGIPASLRAALPFDAAGRDAGLPATLPAAELK